MKISKGALWPVMVVGLLLLNFAVVGVTVVFATRDPSFAVERDYYDKAVAWDAYAKQRAASAALGWTLGAEVSKEETAPGRRTVRVTLRDSAGGAVEGATVEAVVFHNARAADSETVTLGDLGGGVYTGVVRKRQDGVWVVQAIVRRGDDEFHGEARVEVGMEGGG